MAKITPTTDELNKYLEEWSKQYYDVKLKSYGKRVSFVLPQVYDDSLTFYEVLNKLILMLNAEINRAINAEKLLGADLDDEINRAMQAEEALRKALEAEIERAKAEEARLDKKIDDETARAEAEEHRLDVKIDDEIARAEEAERVITENLNSEIARAKQAESDLKTKIEAETARAEQAEKTLQENLDKETAKRQTADKILQDNLDTETSKRQTGDKLLQDNIDTETTARANADADLQSQISENKTAIENEASARTSSDTDLQAQISANKESIGNEATARANADADLQNQITKEVGKRQAGDKELDDKLAAMTAEGGSITMLSEKVNTNAAAISTEAEARTSADNALNQKIEANTEEITSEADRAKAEEAKAVTNVSITSESGTYTLKQTINGTESEIGTITAGGSSSSNNPVIEVKDSVTENSTEGYDSHTFTETTEDGTENNIGTFYISTEQITDFIGNDFSSNNAPDTFTAKYVTQKGKTGKEIIYSGANARTGSADDFILGDLGINKVDQNQSKISSEIPIFVPVNKFSQRQRLIKNASPIVTLSGTSTGTPLMSVNIPANSIYRFISRIVINSNSIPFDILGVYPITLGTHRIISKNITGMSEDNTSLTITMETYAVTSSEIKRTNIPTLTVNVFARRLDNITTADNIAITITATRLDVVLTAS